MPCGGKRFRADVGEAIARSFAERDVAKALAVALDSDMDDIVAIGKELERAENTFGSSVDGAERDKKRGEAHGFPVRHEIALALRPLLASSLPAGDEITVCIPWRLLARAHFLAPAGPLINWLSDRP
jgi:hypothetical protein